MLFGFLLELKVCLELKLKLFLFDPDWVEKAPLTLADPRPLELEIALASTFTDAEAPPRRLFEGPLKLICDFVIETKVRITLIVKNLIVFISILLYYKESSILLRQRKKSN